MHFSGSKIEGTTLIAHVHTSWNLCLLLIFARTYKPKRVILLVEEDIRLIDYLKENIKDFELEVLHFSSIPLKLQTLRKLKKVMRKDSHNIFVKFTNFSYFSQRIIKLKGFKLVIFLDEGTSFLNILNKKIVYGSRIRKYIKKLCWPLGEPRFDDFTGIDYCFLSHLALIENALPKSEGKFNDINIFFSYGRLQEVVKDYLQIEDKIMKWKELLEETEILVLGSALVEHNFMTSKEYNSLLNGLSGSNPTLYKPHPKEKVKLNISSFKYEDLSYLPIELFLAFSYPKRVISFSSTSNFLLVYSDFDISIETIVIDQFYSEEILNALAELKDPRLQINYKYKSKQSN